MLLSSLEPEGLSREQVTRLLFGDEGTGEGPGGPDARADCPNRRP